MRPLQKTALVGLSNEEQIHRLHLKGHIEYLASLEEISWRQKSQALFVKEGDNNTRFFHRLANSHRNANQIKQIEVDGVLYEDESDIRSQLVLFYQGLYKETEAGRPTMDGLDFACIEEEERSKRVSTSLINTELVIHPTFLNRKLKRF